MNGNEYAESLHLFAADANEALRFIEQSLLALEHEPNSKEHVNVLYRALHTMKGNAAFVDLSSIEVVAHAAEDLFSLVRDSGVPLDAELAELMYRVVDALATATREVEEHQRDVPIEPLKPLVEALRAAYATRMGSKPTVPEPVPRMTVKSGPGFALFHDAPPRPREPEPAPATEPQREARVDVEEAESASEVQKSPAASAKAAAGRREERAAEFLRVDAAKISALMDLANELGLACSAVTHNEHVMRLKLPGFAAAAHKLELLVREVQTDLSSLRLVSVSPMFNRLRRVVRDASRRTGKEVELVLQGEETEIDKVMIDALQDPLVHILRNAVDHGLESPEERAAVGKRPGGTITLSALQQGGEVTIEIRDDGRGLVYDRILARAKERGLCAADATLSESEIAELIMLPGFSTKTVADELSGRGVGMDVVKTTVEALRGRVAIRSTPGQGTLVRMTLPLTLAFVEALVVRKDARLLALPIEKVLEVSKLDGSRILPSAASGSTLIRVQDQCVPVLWLHRYWGEPAPENGELAGQVIVVVQTSRGALALPVDQIVGNQQVMLKPMRGLLAGIRAVAGCGMLRTGDVAVALDCEQLAAA